jgi:ankyrin repeat protein
MTPTYAAQKHNFINDAGLGMQEQVEEFVAAHPKDIDTQDQNGWTALMKASFHGQKEIVLFLLEKGASVHVRTTSQHTALMAAANRGQSDIMEILLDRGAKLEERNTFQGWTSLFFAASWSQTTRAVRILLERGANPEARDDHGQTPAQIAKEKGHLEVAGCLDRRVEALEQQRLADKKAEEQWLFEQRDYKSGTKKPVRANRPLKF